MKRLLGLFALWMCVGWASAQTLWLSATHPIAPVGSYVTVTAVVNGVSDRTVTWSITSGSGGILAGTNPCTVINCTIALYYAGPSARTFTIKATSNANSSVTATATIDFTASPTPGTTHPRLIFTAAMLSALQAKATGGNPMFQANLTAANANWTTNDNPTWSWSCNSGTGLPTGGSQYGYSKEQDAFLFAWLATMAPASEPTGGTCTWGNYSHDLWMYVMNGVINGDQPTNGNDWSDNAQQYMLTSDWLIGAGFLNGGSGATATATLSGSSVTAITITAGGSGYAHSATYNWYAFGGSCTPTSHQNGVAIVGNGTTVSNSSGVIVDPSPSITVEPTGCSTAPTIVIYTEQDVVRAFLYTIVKNSMNLPYGTQAPVAPGYNSPSLIVTGSFYDLNNMRVMGNNYTMAKMLFLGAAGLTFNDNTADDPSLANTCSATRYQVCPDFTAGSLHAYARYLFGGMFYMMWPHLSDPNVVQQAYNAAYSDVPSIPNCLYGGNVYTATSHPCYGDGRDGEASEGSWYAESFVKLRQVLNLIYTAGYADPIVYGPQMSLSTDSFWDLKTMEDSAFLTTNAIKNGPTSGSPAFSYLTTGDTYKYFRVPSDLGTEGAILTFDTYTGRTDRLAANEWPILNVAFGGPDGTQNGCTIQCGFDTLLGTDYAGNTTTIPYDLFQALPAADPVASPPADPRPGFPTDYYNASFNQHTMVRSGWSNPTLYSNYCPNAFIDHEEEFCGRFDIMANGEYITRGRVEFNDYNTWIAAAPQQSIASYINTDNHAYPCSGCYIAYAVSEGGQGWHIQQQNLTTNRHSELPAYAAQIADTTGVSNYWWTWWGPPDYDDVLASSRSTVYLRGSNQVVFYDRGTTTHSADKSVYFNVTGTPTISGNVAHWLTQSGTQKGFYTTLLPASPTFTNNGAPCVNCSSDQAWDWEYAATLQVDGGSTTGSQFLSALEWGPSSMTQTATTLMQSTSGMAFDGAKIGTSLVMFEQAWPATFTSTTFPASSATAIYVSDLAPSTSYPITAAGGPGTAVSDTAGVLAFSVTGTGNVTIGSGTPQAATPTYTPSAGAYTSTQNVTIASTTGGATLCYTADGSTPLASTPGTCSHGTTYSSPVSIAVTTTLMAIATESGFLNSTVASGTYTITGTPQAATPTFAPLGNTYTSVQTVTISDSTPSPTIYYTTDGTTPTTGSTVYSGPITVSTSQAVKAIATAPGFLQSAVGEADYVINIPAPQIQIRGTTTISGSVTF